jgi:hypothetical protein
VIEDATENRFQIKDLQIGNAAALVLRYLKIRPMPT